MRMPPWVSSKGSEDTQIAPKILSSVDVETNGIARFLYKSEKATSSILQELKLTNHGIRNVG